MVGSCIGCACGTCTCDRTTPHKEDEGVVMHLLSVRVCDNDTSTSILEDWGQVAWGDVLSSELNAL